jgi:hypothetical protein
MSRQADSEALATKGITKVGFKKEMIVRVRKERKKCKKPPTPNNKQQ